MCEHLQTLREIGIQLRGVSLSRACLGECVRLILGRMLGQREARPASPRRLPDAESSVADGDASAAGAATTSPTAAASSDAHSTSGATERSRENDEDDAEFEHYFASRDERKFVCTARHNHIRYSAEIVNLI